MNGPVPAPALALTVKGVSVRGTSASVRGEAREVGDGDGDESGDPRPFSDMAPDVECAIALLLLPVACGLPDDVALGLLPSPARCSWLGSPRSRPVAPILTCA